MQTSLSIIGKRIPKKDALHKVTGQARYGHDIHLPGMLHGRILYAQHPHARIISIDTSAAENFPGVQCVLTAADNPPTRFGFGKDNTPFKGEVVRSMRDEVAGVVAVDENTAEEALALIRVEYQPLPAVFSPQQALAENAPLIHPQKESNRFQNYIYGQGDLETGERESAVVIETHFSLPYVAHCCMEPSVIVAQFEPNGHLTLWSTTQIPFLLQRDLAEALGMQGNQIRVIQTAIGGSFGRGLDIYPYEPIAALMARKAGRPVRLSFSRAEEFTATPLRQPVEVTVRAGADQNGKLTFRDVSCVLDLGAYVSWGSVTPLVMMETAASLYQVPHVRFLADCVYTNNPVTGAMRGYGNPQSTFFIETVMDQLAEALEMDPIDFRLRNANQANTVTPQGLEITSCGLEDCLKAVAASADQAAPPSPQEENMDSRKRGVGFASTLNVGGGARIYRSDGCGATVKMDDFGHVTLITGSSEIGQGSETVLSQIVAETLGVFVEDISVINSDTDVKPWDVGVHASRTTFIAGNAAQMAALEARKQIFETASKIFQVPPESLIAKDGMVRCIDNPDKSMPIAKVVRRRHYRTGGQVIIGEGWYDPPTQIVDKDTYKGNISATYGFGSQMAEVEVDTETGNVRVLRLVCAHDIGKAINPMLVEGQIEGGAQMGLGYALSEELIVQEGKILNPDFLDYRLFTTADMPRIETILIESDDPIGPFGAKGVGEMGGTPVAAAIANAVYDAIGVRITTLPITPERILRALQPEISK